MALVLANGFCGGHCDRDNLHGYSYILDVKVFNPHAPSNRTTNSKAIYRKHQLATQEAFMYMHEAHICEAEYRAGSFSSDSFTCSHQGNGC